MKEPRAKKADIVDSIFKDIEAIRKQKPLIHNITNLVAMQHIANALLAIGASPIMAHSEDELADIIKIANGLAINIGTIDLPQLSAMRKAMHLASLRPIPIVLDPVGAGASELRTRAVYRLLAAATPTVIRGNASEIIALVSAEYNEKGVDSIHKPEQALESATQLVNMHKLIVVTSGAVDICLARNRKALIYNGDALMTKVTGVGCSASALIAAFCAVNPDAFVASVHAAVVMGIAGEKAASKAQGPGTFLPQFYDVLYNLSMFDIAEKIHVECFY